MILLIFNVFPIRIMFCEREVVRIQTVLDLAFETVKIMSKEPHSALERKYLCVHTPLQPLSYTQEIQQTSSQEVMLYDCVFLNVVEH